MLTVGLLGVLFLGALGVLLLLAIVQRARLELVFSRIAWCPPPPFCSRPSSSSP